MVESKSFYHDIANVILGGIMNHKAPHTDIYTYWYPLNNLVKVCLHYVLGL